MIASLIPWAIEALKLAAFAAIKPLFMALINSLLSPKFLLKTFIQIAEMLVKHTETKFDDEMLASIKVSMQEDLDKHLKQEGPKAS